MMKLLVLVCLTLVTVCYCADPTNYQEYTGGGIHSGLDANSAQFKLNGKPFRILGGSLHYFRLPWQYWKDRLDKFKAAGLNTVTTYVAWNMHEPHPDQWNFDRDNLNLPDFLKACKEADLFVHIRIGPFINAEFENGGIPWWLLKDPRLNRHGYKGFEDATLKYFEKVMQVIAPWAFQKGGPIIALQYENEYFGINNDGDRRYFDLMKNTIEKSGFRELLTNCDPGGSAANAAKHLQKGVLETVNTNSLGDVQALRKAQPNRPVHVTESYPGWYDNWGMKHNRRDLRSFENQLNDILFKGDASINLYMFFGGTNFGWTAASEPPRQPVTTSYDYDGVLTEAGHYTDKYHKCREMMIKLINDKKLPKVHIPDPPRELPVKAYGNIKFVDYLTLDDLTSRVTPINTNQWKNMEQFDQGYGFILYRFSWAKFSQVKVPKPSFTDRGILIIDDVARATQLGDGEFVYHAKDSDFLSGSGTGLLIENMGRDKFANAWLRKGLENDVYVDNKKVTNYQVFRLDFPEDWVKGLKSVKGHPFSKQSSPTLYRAELNISGAPEDTFLRFDGFNKGSVFVNGFNIGRYWDLGPQKTLYLPAVYLKQGQNDIYVFELHQPNDHFVSTDKPDLG